MNIQKLKRAFKKSDFDEDGYLNEFETNHFAYLLFGHKNSDELYTSMCTYCDSNPMFGLSFGNILQLYPIRASASVSDDGKQHNPNKKSKKSKKKKKDKKESKKDKKKKKKTKKDKKNKDVDGAAAQTLNKAKKSTTNVLPEQASEQQPDLNKQQTTQIHFTSNTQKDINLDEIDDWGELPPSDNECEEHFVSMNRGDRIEQQLNHIRTISAFVMSGLKDSSDSEKDFKATADAHKTGDDVFNEDEDDDADVADNPPQPQQANNIALDLGGFRREDVDQGDVADDEHDHAYDQQSQSQSHHHQSELVSSAEAFSLKQQVLQWQDRFTELEQNKEMVQERYKKLQLEYENLQNEHSDLSTEHHNLCNEHNVKLKQLELERLNEEETQLRDTEHEEKLHVQLQKIDRLQVDKTDLQDRNKKLNAEISELSESIDSLNELCQKYTDDIAEFKDMIERLQSEKEELMQQMTQATQATSNASEMEEQLQSLTTYNEEWKQKYSALQEELQQTDTERVTLSNTVIEYEKQLSTVTTPLQQYTQLEKKLTAVQSELSRVQQQLKQTETQQATNESTITVMQTQRQQLESALEAQKLQSQQQLQLAQTRYEQQSREYEQRIEQNASQMSTLDAEITRLRQLTRTQQQRIEQQDEVLKQQPVQRRPSIKKTESSKMVDLLMNDSQTQNDATFDINFFTTTNIESETRSPTRQPQNNQLQSVETTLKEQEEDELDLSMFAMQTEAEDENENEQVQLSSMDDLSGRQKFLLMKARMMAQENNEDDA